MYITEKLDHRVHTAIKNRDKTVGLKLLTMPSAHTKPNPNDVNLQILDRDCEEFIEYQIEIKNMSIVRIS